MIAYIEESEKVQIIKLDIYGVFRYYLTNILPGWLTVLVCRNTMPEIKPVEPDPDNAGVGNN